MCWISACSSDSVSTSERILGVWKIDKALRNERITNSLEGLYFQFLDSTSLQSNLLGDTMTFACIINKKSIQIEKAVISNFEIVSLTDTTMQLNTELQDNELSFYFKR